MVGCYKTQEYSIGVAGRTLRLLGPELPHALHAAPRMRRRFEAEGYKPYWAEPWPTAVMLAEHVIRHVAPAPAPVLELGAGLGIAGISLALAGHRVVVTDYDEDALAFVRASAALNNVELADVRLLDWRDPPAETFATIVASDVLYEKQNHEPIAVLIAACLNPGGGAFVSDLNRRAADDFPDALRTANLTCREYAARAKAIAAFDATDERMLNGRVFGIFKKPSQPGRAGR